LLGHQFVFQGLYWYGRDKFAKLFNEWVFVFMRRPITYAELLLILILGPLGVWGAQNLYGFVTDRITIEVKMK